MGNQHGACPLETVATRIPEDLSKTANLDNFINKLKP
jgi:hypothetical protein